ncbi:hypothetical protein [Paractinoplanes lichenicola]|uniref:Uncharacterized protein n=1 Tax=Paractinoplanes lichenicola TaxID=2802976 RepID=A0ABS1VM98_9ACTN|nr:hypothetical protein [Actinoplanes lichenicola]MBL7255770.1 hypothetical protein [Actinoplanes lichenicola]
MTTTDEQLRPHDPARHIPDHLVRAPHAAATLTRIMATEPGTGTPAVSARPARRARRVAQFALAGVVATVGLAAAPILGTDHAATATWEAVARPATPQELAENGRECAEWTRLGPGATPRMVEMRGAWVMTYVTTATGEAQCLSSTVKTAEYPDGEGEASSGPLLPVPAANALATSGVHMTSGGVSSGTQFMVSGKAGSQVTAITFSTQDMQVKATVKDGYFTAWWPKRKPDTIAGRLIDYSGYNGSPNPEVTITLRNGQTIETRIKDYDVNQ